MTGMTHDTYCICIQWMNLCANVRERDYDFASVNVYCVNLSAATAEVALLLRSCYSLSGLHCTVSDFLVVPVCTYLPFWQAPITDIMKCCLVLPLSVWLSTFTVLPLSQRETPDIKDS